MVITLTLFSEDKHRKSQWQQETSWNTHYVSGIVLSTLNTWAHLNLRAILMWYYYYSHFPGEEPDFTIDNKLVQGHIVNAIAGTQTQALSAQALNA